MGEIKGIKFLTHTVFGIFKHAVFLHFGKISKAWFPHYTTFAKREISFES